MNYPFYSLKNSTHNIKANNDIRVIEYTTNSNYTHGLGV